MNAWRVLEPNKYFKVSREIGAKFGGGGDAYNANFYKTKKNSRRAFVFPRHANSPARSTANNYWSGNDDCVA